MSDDRSEDGQPRIPHRDDAAPGARRAADADEPTPDDAGATATARRALRRPRVTKKRLGFGALALILAAILLVGGLAAYYITRVNGALGNVKRDNYAPTNTDRPAAPTVTGEKQPMTFVLIGSDTRAAGADARSDSLMVAYLPANREHVYVISVPRDTYVEIPGKGKNKINAAYMDGQVPLTVQTLEKLFKVRMQHAAVIDFGGFIKLTDVLGGVTVDNPVESDDPPKWHYPKGKITIQGDYALAFVRQRHGLKDGDLTRALRQRAVIRGIISKALSMGVLTNPGKFGELLDQVSTIVTVDRELTDNIIKDTALGLHLRSGEDVRGLSIPLSDFATVKGVGAIDVLDEKGMAELSKAMQTDTMDRYYEAHKNDPLIGPVEPTASPSPSAAPSQATSAAASPRATTARPTTPAPKPTVATTKPTAATTKPVTKPASTTARPAATTSAPRATTRPKATATATPTR